jgi:hypothetical protein
MNGKHAKKSPPPGGSGNGRSEKREKPRDRSSPKKGEEISSQGVLLEDKADEGRPRGKMKPLLFIAGCRFSNISK